MFIITKLYYNILIKILTMPKNSIIKFIIFGENLKIYEI